MQIPEGNRKPPMSTAVITPAPTSFAEFEAAGGKMPTAPATEPVVETQETEETSGVAEDATEAEAEPETAQQNTQEKPAEPQKGAEKRTLSSERDKLLAEVTELRKQRRELQEQSRSAPEAQPAKPAEQAKEDKPKTPRPKLSNWTGTLEELEDAQEKWDSQEKLSLREEIRAEFAAKEAEAQRTQQQERVKEAYKEKLIKHLEQHPDYDNQIDQTPMSDLMAQMVMHHGPDLGQALIDNRAEAARISKLSRDSQIFEMGRLSGARTAPAAAEPESPEKTETDQPVKVPAKLTANGGGSSNPKQPRNFAEWQAAQERLNTRR